MIVVVPYLLILGGHVMLPGLVPFALLLAASGAGAVVASRCCLPSRAAPLSPSALDGAAGSERMRANLRALEAELHVLEDQRRTELAHERHARSERAAR